MARILGVGIATLDIINTVSAYPPEDAEVRAVSQRLARGGNATNTLVVLSQLGHDSHWAGTLALEPDAEHILHDLARFNIDTSHCWQLEHGKVPTSYVSLSQQNGSRTIVHYRDLPEYDFAHFRLIDLHRYHWLHFEGRNVGETRAMLAHAKAVAPAVTRSLEVEKPRPDIETLFGEANILLFSRAYAHAKGYDEPEPFLRKMALLARDASLVCAWGDQGAYGLHQGDFITSPAQPPAQVIDTLGAGDTFNAGIIHARLAECDWPTALEAANRLAGKKIGRVGFAGLACSTV